MRQRQSLSVAMATVALLGVSAAGSVLLGDSAAAAGTQASLTTRNVTGAKLPAGACSTGESGVPRSGAIQLSKGTGSVGSVDSLDYFGAKIIGSPVSIDLGVHRAGVAVVIGCGQGGSDVWTSLWVFQGSPNNLTTLFGGMTPRSYAQGPAGSLLTGVQVKGHALVVHEVFSKAGDTCMACSSGKLSTTWGWSSPNGAHLVMTEPRPKKVKVVAAAAPTGFLGGPASINQAGPRVVAGRSVLATCTAQPPDSSERWTELDTGAWLPSSDLASVELPDCDGGTTASTTTTTGATSSSAPCTAAAITPAAVAGLTGTSTVSTFGCAGAYAYAGVDVSGQPGQGGESDEITRVLMAVNGAWQMAPEGACTSGAIPSAIVQMACESN
jgi:hypothetical protein